MQVKFLKEIVEDLIGKEAVPIIDLLVGKKDVNEFFEKVKAYGNENEHRFMLCGKCLGVFVDYKPPVCSCGNFHGQKFREITGVMRMQLQAGHKIEKIMSHWII